MKAINLGILLLLVPINAKADDGPTPIQAADTLFRSGKFGEAEASYAEIVAKAPDDFRAVSQLGTLGLFSNRFTEAEKWLEKAIQIKPKDAASKLLLAEVFYRQDKFELAAPLLRDAGQETRVKTLESFRGLTRYEVQSQAKSTTLKFLVTNPLPLVQVKVNGKEAIFLIDTGAAEVILDPEFANQVRAKEFGSLGNGTFAGGKNAGVQAGRIDLLALGDFEIKNVPVMLLSTRQFAPIFGGKQIDGIIGTVLFYHFLATLDYPRGELVLHRNTEENRKGLDNKATVIPFWMAGDHFIVAWGKIEKLSVLWFVDTGLAGGGVTCAESIIKEAGIKLSESQAGEGIGGGGKVKVVPFTVKELSLGDATAQDVRGLFLGAFPLENAFGFRIGGIISHGFFRPYAVTFDFTGMRLVLRNE
jgi:predicted aspartyl protease